MTDNAALSREGGADERAGEGRSVLEQRGQLDAGDTAQGGVDLLEHAALGEPLTQVSCDGVDRGGGLPGRQGPALGVDRNHAGVGGGERGRREDANRARAREEAARIAGAGQVIGDDRDHLGWCCRHEWITVSQNGRRPGGAHRGGAGAGVYTLRVKSRVVVALLALAAVLAPGVAAGEDPVAALSLIRPKPAKDAPDFELPTPDDRVIRLVDLKGKVVFLNFWATWCEPCREEMPSMERLHLAYKDRGLVVVAVSVDSQGASVVRPFVKKFGLTLPIGLDPKMTVRERYGVWAVPSTFLIDREGKRVLFANGAREWDGKAAHAVIESLLK